MTLANCERLLKHFQDTKQVGRVKEMEKHIELKILKIKANMNNPTSPYHKYLDRFSEKPVKVKEVKEKKSDIKKS